MNISLPSAVAAFFAASNGMTESGLGHCFTEQASVSDENHTHRGIAAIHAWLLQARSKFTYFVEPLEAAQDGDMLKVRARVSGNFPGSPVELDHIFRLEGDLIRTLEIR